jgi:hypothetical protein
MLQSTSGNLQVRKVELCYDDLHYNVALKLERNGGGGLQVKYRQHANLHHSPVNVTKYQKGVHCIGVKVFNMLPFYIKAESDNPKKFKALLQKYLCENSFYSLDEYFELQVKF